MQIDIYQISKILSKQRINSFGLFEDKKTNTVSKYSLLYLGIIKDTISNDQEAIRKLNFSKKSTFIRFKNRYSNKLLDYFLLHQNTNHGLSEYFSKYLQTLKLFTTGRILHVIGQKKNAVPIYINVHKIAKKYEFADISLLVSIQLKKHFGYIESDESSFTKYTSEVSIAQSHLTREIEMNLLYDKISHDNLFDKENTMELNNNTLIQSTKLYDSIKEDDLYILKLTAHELLSYSYFINNNPQKSLEISKKSLDLYHEYGFDFKLKKFIAYKNILYSNIKLKEYKEAHIYLQKILNFIDKIGHNYFRFKGLEFSLYAVTKDYNKMYILTHEVLNIKKIKEFSTISMEWNLRKAFVNILVESGKIPSKTINEKPQKRFRLNRFINTMDNYTKDKRGMNIAIHVVQLMYFLIRKEYSKMEDRYVALNLYSYRYLRNDKTLRSNCFIKMLLKMPEAKYNPIRTKRYVKKYEQKLTENPFEITMKAVSVELIPYEHLWEIIMEILGKKLKMKNEK